MKKYNTKKNIIITLLSVTVIALVIGLFYYIGTMKPEQPVTETPPIEVMDPDVNVGKIEVPSEPIIDPQDDTEPTLTDSEETEPIDKQDGEEENTDLNTSTDPTQPTNQEKPSDGKPKTKDEATPPTDTEPPVVDDNGEEEQKVYEPDKDTSTPADGTISADGTQIYVGGFGWIPWEGGGSEVTDAPNAGTGDLIGY